MKRKHDNLSQETPTQLHFALKNYIWSKDYKKIQELSEIAGASLNNIHLNQEGIIADDPIMHVAVEYGDLEIVKILIEKGVHLNQVDKYGTTTFYRAIMNHQIHIVEFFIQNGEKVNQVDNDGDSPLSTAIQCISPWDTDKSFQIIEFLIQNGADINHINNRGYSPLWYAVEFHNYKVLELLIKNGADIKQVKNGESILISTVIKGNWHIETLDEPLQIIKLLIENGLDVNQIDKEGRTALCEAVDKSDYKIAELLIINGAKISSKTMELPKLAYSKTIRKLFNDTLVFDSLFHKEPSKNFSMLPKTQVSSMIKNFVVRFDKLLQEDVNDNFKVKNFIDNIVFFYNNGTINKELFNEISNIFTIKNYCKSEIKPVMILGSDTYLHHNPLQSLSKDILKVITKMVSSTGQIYDLPTYATTEDHQEIQPLGENAK